MVIPKKVLEIKDVLVHRVIRVPLDIISNMSVALHGDAGKNKEYIVGRYCVCLSTQLSKETFTSNIYNIYNI